jgi:hypothetical protein
MNMNDSPLNRYRGLMNELLILREFECGDLPVEIESAYVERLDELWWGLSEKEQAEYEAELANATTPPGPKELALVDCVVNVSSRSAPRKAA